MKSYQFDPYFKKLLTDFIRGKYVPVDQDSVREFEHMIDVAMDDFKYTGDMYRVLMFGREPIHDVRWFLAKLQEFEQWNHRRVFSWSKNLNGIDFVIDWAGTSHGEIGMILKQSGDGFDVLDYFAEYDVAVFDEYFREREVLAPLNNSVHLVGFVVDGKTFSVYEFNKVI
jgi:hypothetical protein